MKKRSIRLIDLHLQLKTCMSNNQAKVAANAALATASTTLTTRVGLEEQLQNELEQVIKGAAVLKKQTRVELAGLTDAMRRRVQASYALNDKPEGFRNANITYSDVAYGAYLTGISRARNVYEMANGLSAADKTVVGITAINLTELDKAIISCESANPRTRSSIILRQNAENNLTDALKQTSKFVHETMDSLMGAYRMTDPSFYNEWLLARTFVNARASHAQITGTVMDATTKAPLVRVKVTATNGIKVYEDMTDREGNYKIPVSPELYNVSFELPAYVEQDMHDVLVDAGQREQVDVKMVKEGN